MDFISHGLYGGIAFGRRSKRQYLTAFIFGMIPDLLSFGPFFIMSFLGITKRLSFSSGPPSPALIPTYVHVLYNITHSLVIAFLIIGIASLVFGRRIWPLGAWPLHVLMDIPTHTSAFFPTPFLWPISNFTFSGISWASPIVFIPNVLVLVTLYFVFFLTRHTT